MTKNLLPAAALLCGAGGAALRVWEQATAFEAQTGLPLAGAPASLLLAGFSALFALVLLLLVRKACAGTAGRDFDRAFACPSPGYITAVVSAAVLPVCAAGFLVWGGISRTLSPISFLPAALFLFASGAVVSTGRNNYRSLGQGAFSTALLLPPLAFCCQLMLTYHEQAGNPVLQEYAYLLLSIVCTVLGLYFMAGFAFEGFRPRRFLWSAGLAVYFSCITAADVLTQALSGQADWPVLFLSAFSIVYFTVHSGVLLRNLTDKEETPHE